MQEPTPQTSSTAHAADRLPDMQRIAHHIWQISSSPSDRINNYLVEDVLIDTGIRPNASHLLEQLVSVPLSLVALTHCHPDHQGAARLICETRDIPLACHEADAASMEGRAPMLPDTDGMKMVENMWAGPAYPVQRVLHDGDEIAGFRVIHTPGHTPGHVIYFRASDRVAIVGDLLCSMNPLTGEAGLDETPDALTWDREESRLSIRKLAKLNPALICFGHGPVLRDMEQFYRFIARRLSSSFVSSMNDVNQTLIMEFRTNGGQVSGFFASTSLLLLTTIGARSGQPRVAPLVYTTDGDRLVIIAAKAGAPTNPDWYHNLLANPTALVEVGSERFQVRATEAPPQERERLYAQMAEQVPVFAEYPQKTSREIPVIILSRIEQTA